MMRIFIDIDNIVADFETAFRRFLNKKTGQKLDREDIREFEFHKSFGITKEEEKKFHDEFFKKNGYKKLKCVKGCKEGIQRLEGFWEIKYITARSKDKRNQTLDWFKRNKIPFREDCLIFIEDKLSYSSQFDLIIEDKWEEAIKLAENNKIVVLFDYPWNRKRDENGNYLIHENIIRVSNWEEIIRAIEDIAEESYKEEFDKETLEIWKGSIGVQMHFNQLIMRNRMTIASIIFAAFGAALALSRWRETIIEIKEIPLYMSDVIIFVAAVALFSYFWIDTRYYFKLLTGAVRFTEKMDKKYKNLGLTSSITNSIKHKEARIVLQIHYFIIFIALLIIVISRFLILF